MRVQEVLSATGIPTYPGAWVPPTDGAIPPAQYIVHTYLRAPAQAADDAVTATDTYAYVNLWSRGDPAAAIETVRAAATTAGWGIVDERGAEYDDGMYRTSWTFAGWG